MIAAIMISHILFTTSNNFRVIIPNNIFQARRKVWNGKKHPTKTYQLKKNFCKTVLLAGLLVGSLDIVAALVNFYINTGKDPKIVLKYIASAVLGRSAFSASASNTAAVWGLLLHFLIAFIWTFFFFLLYPKLKLFSWNRIITGILYG